MNQRDFGIGEGGIYWAVIGYYRWWLAFDQPELFVLTKPGSWNGETVRRVAKRYSVNRRIPADANVEELALALRDELPSWRQSSFTEKAAKGVCFAKRAAESEWTIGVEVSLVSKLMWFLSPTGWTMYDALAANGVGIPSGNSRDRSKAFYGHLEAKGFLDRCGEGNALIRTSDLAGPLMERVFDQYFWLVGRGPEVSGDVRTFSAYLHGLPVDWRKSLVDLASEIASKVRPIPRWNAT